MIMRLSHYNNPVKYTKQILLQPKASINLKDIRYPGLTVQNFEQHITF
jgi:hypothetical protein